MSVPGRLASSVRCAQCQREFSPWKSTTHFCSRACIGAWRHDHPEPRPFTLAPLVPLVGGHVGRGANQWDPGFVERLATVVGRLWGCPGKAATARIHRWQRSGLTVREADTLAVALGYHPANLWTTWWDVTIEEGMG